ncbi:Por secretion system C-terminal sorting domain-containing protein [Chryseobacterium oranimense]|uniref:Por secretion system C-terminal sorting domain-containing protein n=2 Tax=Chryseobacterium oranimense TaxID=421058 RepID=A0A1M5T2S0_9FLAO|nr:Por secretion system C-terminal sorting domain-containing protein [Chryseobacterium oranimense]
MCLLFLTMGIAAQTTVTIGAGASTATAGTNGDPIYRSSGTSTYHYSKSVQLLTAADLAGASVISGSSINSIGYYKTTAFNVSGSNAWTLNVYLKNSSATALASGTAWDTMTGGATLFYSATINSTNNFPAAAGWVTFTNNTANTFSYTGGAIEVYIDWVPSGTLASPYTGGAFQWKYDTTTSVQAIGTSNSSAIAGTNTSYTTQTRRYQTQLTYTATACSGAPNPGNTLATATSTTCAAPYSTTLSLQNFTVGTGVSYQWYNNAGAIAGATSSTYTATVSAADSFYCAVTCSGSGITTNSAPVSVSGPAAAISTLPWTENFDSMSNIGSGIVPSCWTNVTGTKAWASMNAASVSYNVPKSTPNYMTIAYSNTTASQLWTPAFQLTAGTSYDLSFYYNTGGTSSSYVGYTGNVLVNNSISTTGATDLGTFITATQGTTAGAAGYVKVTKTFVPATSGVYMFALNVSSTGAPWYLGVDDFTLETTPSCVAPTALTSASVTASGATVSWTAPATAPANGYDIYYSTSNTAPTAGTIPNATSTTTSAPLTNLTATTTYYVWVRSNCGAGSTSSWSGPTSFTTACSVITPNYTNDFATFPGTCWSLANGGTPATGPGTGTTNYWVADGFLNAGSTGAARMNLYSTGRQGWLKSPAFNLSAGGYRVKFDYGVTGYNVTTASAMGSDDVVQFLVSTDGGTTWTILKTWDTSNTPTNTSNTYIFDLANYIGTNTVFAVYGNDGTVDDTQDYDFFVDNFVVESIPACDIPTALTSSLITDTSATISWTAPGTAPANGYQYYYSTTNTAPTSGTATTAVSQNLTSLLPQTTYYYWVRSMCAGTQSAWVSGTFTTLATPPANDNCSSAVSLTVGGAFAQHVVTGTTVGSTNTTALSASCLSTPTNVAGNVWYKVVVPASGSVTVETDATTGTALTDTVISVFADCTSTTSIACDDDSGNANFSKVSLTGQTPGATLYVSVWRFSNAGGGTDGTFQVSAYDASLLATSEVSQAKNDLKAYPNPFADVLNISDISKVKSVSIVDVAGRVVKTIENPSSALQLGDLKQGLYLVTLNMKDGSKQTIKAIKK